MALWRDGSQHSREVLREVGYDEARIDELVSSCAVFE